MLNKSVNVLYDRILLWLILGLIFTGIVMVASTSMLVGSRLLGDPFYFVKRNMLYVGLSFLISLFLLRTPVFRWHRYSLILLLVSFVLLIVVLLFGNTVHGSSRWLSFGWLSIQPAELSKLSLFCYLSSYFSYKFKNGCFDFYVFCKPILIMLSICLLVLVQPDFGSAVVIFATTLGILFIASIRLRKFFLFVFVSVFIVVGLILIEPYRIERIFSFWNPWQDPFGSGYQLTQSLMAFGRGKLWGRGLGNSIQKMEYLPEAHTDFIFAIIAEEFGYCGAFLVLLMIFSVVFRALAISRHAFRLNMFFSGFLSCAIGIWFSFQTIVNVGVTVGLLPTKGLTFPFISYGGSSFMVLFCAVILLLRIDFELRISELQAFAKGLV
ncbi:cell division protein FtsW [Blochmannia endosymbiont of Colobopsis nipponica]|uniref:cell division protein FtsW n=1 Tax=Blochmannia endosymbiont of Colobopsis nipponica TaxID=2681987 RepID=UPI001780F780|nr:cell division protein FtsW [Blochmannia endosymbiont of Colobopsis nipponica]QOI11267.1 cell division protein FtsW [Blochmannia endosymbiont of Colobopsis nipponica]